MHNIIIYNLQLKNITTPTCSNPLRISLSVQTCWSCNVFYL